MNETPNIYRKHSGILHGQSISGELHHLALELVMEIEEGSVSEIRRNRESANSLHIGKSKSSPKQRTACLPISRKSWLR